MTVVYVAMALFGYVQLGPDFDHSKPISSVLPYDGWTGMPGRGGGGRITFSSPFCAFLVMTGFGMAMRLRVGDRGKGGMGVWPLRLGFCGPGYCCRLVVQGVRRGFGRTSRRVLRYRDLEQAFQKPFCLDKGKHVMGVWGRAVAVEPCITGTSRIQSVLLEMQNRTFGPYSASRRRIR
jgi:hypothetical protein